MPTRPLLCLVVFLLLQVGNSFRPAHSVSPSVSLNLRPELAAMRHSRIISTSNSKKPLKALSSSSSDHPDDRLVVPWTVANLFWINDTLLAVYHAAGTAWDNLVPWGALCGAVAHQMGLYQPHSTAWQSAGDAALWTGLGVMVLGIAKLWLFDIRQPQFVSMQVLASDLKRDYNKRVMDQSAWIGCGVAAIGLLFAPPTSYGLTAGSEGVLQGLCLGTVAGSALGFYRQRQ